MKGAVDELTAGWLRAEHRLYAQVDGDFLPPLLGWDEAALPVLALEDLSAAAWPPPWTAQRVDAVLAMLRKVAATPPPPGHRER